ncbi:Ribosomal protein L11 methyltransferase, partial [Ananas comosus]
KTYTKLWSVTVAFAQTKNGSRHRGQSALIPRPRLQSAVQMLGRLHLRLRPLGRLSSLQTPFPPPLLLPTTTAAAAAAAHTTPTSPANRPTLSPAYKQPSPTTLLLLHQSKNRRAGKGGEGSFCTNRAAVDAAADVSAPFYSAHIRCRKRDAVDVSACISNAASSVGLDYVPNYEVSMGKQCDWVTNAQESFHPIEVINGLWIVPKWRDPPDLHTVVRWNYHEIPFSKDPRATNILLNPGLAFGTGEHPTTKLCLLLLHEAIKGGEHFFDYGTGSGVLGIAALKMGAAMSAGIDIEPQAVTSARENLSLNGIESSKMSVYLVPSKVNSPNIESAKGKFDIVIANILMNPLMELAEDIVSYGKPEAVVGVSGILCEQPCWSRFCRLKKFTHSTWIIYGSPKWKVGHVSVGRKRESD